MSEQTTAQDKVSTLAAQLPGQQVDDKNKRRRERAPRQPRPENTPRPVKVRERRQHDAGAEARLTYSVCAALLVVGAVAFWWLCIR